MIDSRHKENEIAAALARCKTAFVGVAVMSRLVNILYLTGSFFMLEVYDRVIPSRSVPPLIGLAALALALYAFQGVLETIRGRILVRVQPQDIDNVRMGQKAVLRFAAFNTRTTPEIDGEVVRVFADVTQDPKTGQSYYTARIRIREDQKERLKGLRLVPGMPVESFTQIGERIAKAWKER